MPIPKPSYTIWQAISAALALATRALNEVRALARMPGPKGDKGDPGEPGLGFDDWSFDGERRLTFKRFDDERVVVFQTPIYRGVWKHDQKYEHCDWVTADGSVWAALVDSQGSRPGSTSKSWQLAVKRGMDSKNA